MCGDRASDTPVAAPTRVMALARTGPSRALPRSPSPRPHDRGTLTSDPGCLPSDEDPCPAVPFRTPGSGLSRLRGLATAMPILDAFHPPYPFGIRTSQTPVHAPPLPAETALLWAYDVARRLLQPETTRGHTRRATDPRTRAELSHRCSPAPTDAGCVDPGCVTAPRACEPQPTRTGFRAVRPLSWKE